MPPVGCQLFGELVLPVGGALLRLRLDLGVLLQRVPLVCMGMRNNRPCRLPALIASIEFIFRVEFKLSSNICGACPDPGPSVYARCLGRPRMLSGRPRRRSALRRVTPRASPSLSYWHNYQREYKTKGLPSDAMGGPFPQSTEFRCAGGLLVLDGPVDTEWHEF